MSAAEQLVSESGWPAADFASFVCSAWHPACLPCVWVPWPCRAGWVATRASLHNQAQLPLQSEGEGKRGRLRQASKGQAWIKAAHGQTPPRLVRWGRKKTVYNHKGTRKRDAKQVRHYFMRPRQQSTKPSFCFNCHSSQRRLLAGHFPEHPYSVQHTCYPHCCSSTVKHLRANEQ